MKIQTASCYFQSAIFEQCATCKQRNSRHLIGRNGGKLTSASGALFWSLMCAMIFQGLYANELCSDWLQTPVTLCILAVAYICILPQTGVIVGAVRGKIVHFGTKAPKFQRLSILICSFI